MTDETTTPDPTPTDPSGPTPGEAWDDVLSRIGDLGESVGRWIRAAANEPDARQKLEQIRAGIDGIGRMADAALGRAVRSDLGHQVKEGAEQAGQAFSDAAQHVTDAAAPHVKNAFAGLSDVFGRAAAKVEEASRRHEAPVPPADVTPPAAPEIPNDRDPLAPEDK